jgi:hypothetical protein
MIFFGELRKHFPLVLYLQDRPYRQVRQSFRSSPKGAAQSNSSSEEGEGENVDCWTLHRVAHLLISGIPTPSSPTTSGIHHFLKIYFVLKFYAYQSGPNFSDTNFSICRGRDFNKNFTVLAPSFLVQS